MVSLLKYIAFIFVIFCFNTKANAYFADYTLTSEQALELGMIPKKQFEQLEKIKNVNNILKNQNLEDDERNKNREKIVIIINDGVRSNKNPEGQTLKFYIDGSLIDVYDVSTGTHQEVTTTDGEVHIAQTPTGFYRIKRVYQNYFSKSFFGASMKYALFFHLGNAIHKTEATWRLGTRASAGCVRMAEKDVDYINSEVLATGEDNRKIAVEKICHPEEENNCFERELYLNRIRMNDVNMTNGNLLAPKIWSYKALVIVKPGLE